MALNYEKSIKDALIVFYDLRNTNQFKLEKIKEKW